jgi:hypothetical protein
VERKARVAYPTPTEFGYATTYTDEFRRGCSCITSICVIQDAFACHVA